MGLHNICLFVETRECQNGYPIVWPLYTILLKVFIKILCMFDI